MDLRSFFRRAIPLKKHEKPDKSDPLSRNINQTSTDSTKHARKKEKERAKEDRKKHGGGPEDVPHDESPSERTSFEESSISECTSSVEQSYEKHTKHNGPSRLSSSSLSDDSVIHATGLSLIAKDLLQPPPHLLEADIRGLRTSQTNLTEYAKLSNFEQLDTLGYGSFGCVHHVRNKVSGKHYACKVLVKESIVKKRQVAHLKNEKNILMSINNPFIVQMYFSYVDNRNIFLILELCGGGELFHLLRRSGRLPINAARFYAAEVVCALEYLHSFKIAYRDLKPENVLLSASGHVKICDFGFAKVVNDRTWTLCGTPEYLAPEVIMGIGHDTAVDWWSLGVLIYEMLAGYPPFYGDVPFEIYERICDAAYRFPVSFDPVTKDIVSKLLVPQKQLRLGSAGGGVALVKQHSFFSEIDWSQVAKLELIPPVVPKPTAPKPDSYFRDLVPNFDNFSITHTVRSKPDPFGDAFADFDMAAL